MSDDHDGGNGEEKTPPMSIAQFFGWLYDCCDFSQEDDSIGTVEVALPGSYGFSTIGK